MVEPMNILRFYVTTCPSFAPTVYATRPSSNRIAPLGITHVQVGLGAKASMRGAMHGKIALLYHTTHYTHTCIAALVRGGVTPPQVIKTTVSVAATNAMRAYATTRATNHGLLLNSANAPGVVPPPTLHTVTHSHSNTSSPPSHQ